MAEKNNTPQKKRRWYNNFIDAYRITARSYPWVGWVMGGLIVVCIALGVLLAALTTKSYVLWAITGLLIGLVVDMVILSVLVRRALYKQIDGSVGAAYQALSQIKRGWILHEEPIALNKNQDLVWRIIGRPGVVLISEGPSSRVKPLLNGERKRTNRVLKNVPVILIESGNEEGQIPLGKLERTLRKQKKVLTREEISSISKRLSAVQSLAVPIPKGVDPMKTRPNRRAIRGK